MRIRPLEASDRDGFVELITEFYQHANNPIPAAPEIRKLFRNALEPQSNYHVVVAEAASQLVGIVSVTFGESSYRTAPFAWCDDLLVLPTQRRAGVGKRLLEAVIQRARDAGCSNVLLGVGESDEQAQAFYRSLGFEDLKNRLYSLPLAERR